MPSEIAEPFTSAVAKYVLDSKTSTPGLINLVKLFFATEPTDQFEGMLRFNVSFHLSEPSFDLYGLPAESGKSS